MEDANSEHVNLLRTPNTTYDQVLSPGEPRPNPRPLSDGQPSYGSINQGGNCYEVNSSSTDNINSVDVANTEATVAVFKRRWYILLVFSTLAFMQGGLCNIWTVIDQSVVAAFGWSDLLVSWMQAWIFGAFLVGFYPFAQLMDRKGLRIPMIISTLAVVIGTVLRCISAETPLVTWFANAGHLFNGISAPVIYSAGPMVSALWFPPKQRATATAIATVMGFAGNAGCFLVGPLVVPSPTVASIIPMGQRANYTNIPEIKSAILQCRYVECAICVVLLVCVLIYFPSKPPVPPSISSSLDKLNLNQGIRDLCRKKNRHFWLIGVAYGLVVSIFSVWTSMFNLNLKNIGITESGAGWLGFWGVTVGCVSAVFIGRIADHLVGYWKLCLLVLLAGAVVATFVFLLLVQQIIPFSMYALYGCCCLQGLFINGGLPLFYEMAIEATYPIPEVVTSGVLNILYNLVPFFFLCLFLCPSINTNHDWMNWCMYAALLISFPLILAFKEQYRRLDVDKGCKLKPSTEENPAA